jgi:hypothetical protein
MDRWDKKEWTEEDIEAAVEHDMKIMEEVWKERGYVDEEGDEIESRIRGLEARVKALEDTVEKRGRP